MPTSDYAQIPDVIRVVLDSRAESVLEIGIGFGKWGALCREYMEISRGRLPHEWRSRIDGIEVFELYRNPMWSAYDTILIGDAMQLIDTLGSYDLILCCDVIEHFEKAEGQRLLSKMLDHGKVVIVTSPIGDAPQDAVYGNDHEEHKSSWSESDFSDHAYRFAPVGATFIAAVSRSPESVVALDVRPLDERLGLRKVILMAWRLLLRRLTGARSGQVTGRRK